MSSWRIINSNENNNVINDQAENENISLVLDNDVKKEIVLCVGKVQSGKTRKIFQLIYHSLKVKNYDIVIFFAGTNNSLYGQSIKRLEQDKNLEDLSCYDKNDIHFLNYKEGKQYVISILKNHSDLENTLKFIYKIRGIQNKKVLIIDDESDYASVNINKTGKSTTYKKITQLYKWIHNGKLLQVTATPFANIISKKSDELNANRIVIWSNYKEYFGIEEFNKIRDNVYEIVDASKNDKKTYEKVIRKCINHFFKELVNNFELFNNLEEVTCLINIDDDLDIHTQIHVIVTNYLNQFIKYNLQEFYMNYISKEINVDSFKKIINEIKENLGLILFNTNGETIENKKGKFNIYIGGIKASRGFTFENLISELILNSPKEIISVDTLLQRCRWFGNRKKIIDHMKIFMNSNIYNALIESIEYVKALPIGEQDIDNIRNEIISLDKKTQFVKSTSKE